MASWTDRAGVDAQGVEIVSNARQVIAGILRQYNDIPLATLAPFAGQRRSGTVQHHVRAPNYRESIVINTVPNFYTRIVGESNSHITLHESNQHFRVNYLHIYCYSAYIAYIPLEFGPSCTTPKEFWAVTSPCRSCNEPINEIPLVFDTTWIQDLSLHRLAICTATDHATTTLDQSIEEFLRDPLVPLNVVFRLDRETATYGIMQELADMCWYSKRKLKDMYGAVRLDDESHSILSCLTPRVKSRDIGLTEIKACNLEHIYNYLCCFIVHVCSFSIGPNENYDVSMWILTTPPNELPWCGIIKQLYMCNRLPALIRLVQLNTEVPAPSCYTYEGSAAQYVGTSIWGSFAGHIAIPRLTILSYYRTGELASHIEMYVTNLYWKCLMMEVGKFYRYRIDGTIENEANEENEDLSRAAAFIMACMFVKYANEHLYLRERLTTTEEGRFNLYIPTDFDTTECANNHLDEDPHLYYSSIYGRFYRFANSREWDMVEIYEYALDKADNIDRYLRDTLSESWFEIYYMTLADCISTIRSTDKTEHRLERAFRRAPVPMWIGNDLRPINRRIDFPPPSSYVAYGEQVAEDMNPVITDLEEKPPLISLSNRSMSRIHGCHNHSPNYLIEILIRLGV